MTETIKKRAAILLLCAIAAASLFYVSTLPGEFLITSRSSMDVESHDFSETILLGTGITWTGLWKPTILEVDFLGEDHFFKGQEELTFDLFIDEDRHIGSISEENLIPAYPLQELRQKAHTELARLQPWDEWRLRGKTYCSLNLILIQPEFRDK